VTYTSEKILICREKETHTCGKETCIRDTLTRSHTGMTSMSAKDTCISGNRDTYMWKRDLYNRHTDSLAYRDDLHICKDTCISGRRDAYMWKRDLCKRHTDSFAYLTTYISIKTLVFRREAMHICGNETYERDTRTRLRTWWPTSSAKTLVFLQRQLTI